MMVLELGCGSVMGGDLCSGDVLMLVSRRLDDELDGYVVPRIYSQYHVQKSKIVGLNTGRSK